jgi:replicative DNA helicase
MPLEPAAVAALMRTPPHSLEAERGVLGSVLLDGERVMDLCLEAGLTEESFHLAPHRLLFAAFQTMAAAHKAIDLLTTVEQLRAMERLEDVGGAAFLEKLVDATPTAAHAEYYIDIVRQKHLLRVTIACARKAEAACYDEDRSADQILSEAEQDFLDIGRRRQGAPQSWAETIKSTVARVDRILSMGPGGMSGLPTGFRDLDRVLRGLRPGEMTVLAARPSMGKTSLAMNICECVALGEDAAGMPFKGEGAQPRPVAVFSLEMSREALALRMLCAGARVSSSLLDGGYLSERETIRKFTAAASRLMKARIFVDDSGGLDVAELRARARRLRRKQEVELIVIDYLQLLHCREYARQGRQLETAAISAQLKAMAKELAVPVMVLSQLSRAPDQRGERSGKPRLSDLRDSGAIEQDADVVLLLRRPCKYPGDKEHDDRLLAIVDVAKHRNGPTGEVRLNFEERYTRFADRADGIASFDVVPEDADDGADVPLEQEA